jgi:hypothetical protein
MLSWNPYSGMALGTLVVAIFLGLWQFYEKRGRQKDLDAGERDFFRRQDLRRWLGIGLMWLLAAAIFAVDVLQNSQVRASTRKLGQVTSLLALTGLIVALLALALADTIATLRYARRHRRDLANEHAAIMREVIRRAGRSDPMPRTPEKPRGASDV